METTKILSKFSISKEDYKKRLLKIAKISEVNFKLIQDNVSIHANGFKFYETLLKKFQKFTHTDKERLKSIIESVYKHQDIEPKFIDYERELIDKIIVESPELFDQTDTDHDNFLYDTVDLIINRYNQAINNQENVIEAFEKIQLEAKSRGLKNYSVWKAIADSLIKGEAPKMAEIIAASSLFSGEKTPNLTEKQIIDEVFLTKMIEWDSKKKILSNKEREYLTGFAYGFEKLNSFHENNARRYLQKLIEAGFIAD